VYPFERFSAGAREVLVRAQEEAEAARHSYVGTEHVLLALLGDRKGPAGAALARLGVEPGRVRQTVASVVGPGQGRVQRLVPTSRVRRVIGLAFEECRRMGGESVTTGHLLLGLLLEPEGVAAQVLSELGVTPERARAVLEELERAPVPPAASPTPVLDRFGRDLTELARRDQLDPVVGREREIERALQILSRRTKNNPALIGEPGVGKTAIAEGVAQQLVAGNAPDALRGKRLVALDLPALVAGTRYRGEFEERLQRVLEEIRASRQVVLFIDELHTLAGAGGAEGAIDAANLLKPALARGELQCIGATTPAEYRRYIEPDGALERRFQPVRVEPPGPEETLDILRGVRPLYERHHRVSFSEGALRAAVRLGDRYLSERRQPDKAIDLLDEAAARVRTRLARLPAELRAQRQELARLAQELAAAEPGHALELRQRERAAREAYAEAEASWRERLLQLRPEIGEEQVAEIVAAWTGVPVARLLEEERSRLLHMEAELHRRVIGQEEAVEAVARAVRRSRAGLSDPRRPLGSFLFAGPTGVGKTELARALAEFLFGSEESMVRLDMSEFAERHAVARLTGAPPGYVGYDEGGQLTEAVRRRRHALVLLDEIEKAHPEVANLLLQVLEDGRLTDAQGRTVSFANTLVVMTSNLGMEAGTPSGRLGFGAGLEDADQHRATVERVQIALRRAFRPEFLNRLDAVVVFRRLRADEVRRILDLLLERTRQRLQERGIELEVSGAARELLAGVGMGSAQGARPLRRTIAERLENPLSEQLLLGRVQPGQRVLVDARDGELVVELGQALPAG
jgi:ATP-dependent Clp protease ATP-binding subunit ClpC